MSYVPFKAVAIMRDLEVRLKNRISGLSVASDLDSNRFPLAKLMVSTDAVWIRFRTDYERSEADGHVDGLGMAQRVYSPHVAEIWFDDASGTAVPTANYPAFVAQVVAEVSKVGTKVILKTGPVMDETTFAAVAAVVTVDSVIKSDDIHPLTSQI